MYKIVLFSGGPYRFEEFEEYVEDIGGLVLKKDRFNVSRGEYFLAEEIKALTIIPEEEEEQLKTIVNRIKGFIQELPFDENKKRKILLCILLHDSLTRNPQWMEKEEIEEKLVCPCEIKFCENSPECFIDLPEVLDAMVEMELLEKRDNKGTAEYRIII
ncbi:MAG: methyl-coenzyme M reductase family protein [Methanothermobacter sp.]|nr:methyl-coenzyme M reductase family protein [Methanothermobacter sp.]